jgi:antitoxin component YwqK of YwqJK toxin-antitoxin module
LVKRGYAVDEATTPALEIKEGASQNPPQAQPFQPVPSTRWKKTLARFYSFSLPQKAGVFLLAAMLLYAVVAISGNVYTETVGEKDVHNNNDTSSEQYHMSKVNGEWVSNGSFASFYDDGAKKEEGLYVNGRKEGAWLTFFPNGNISTKIMYHEGYKNGSYEEHFEDGKLKFIGSYQVNKAEGRWTRYFSDQNVQIIDTFSNDMANGIHQSFFENGNLESQGRLVNNVRVGEWIYNNDHGTMVEKTVYRIDGNIFSDTKYWDTGLISYRIEYDSVGNVLTEDYFDKEGKNVISKFIGTWRDKGTDFHSVDMITRSSDKIKIDASKKYEESQYSYFENSQMAMEGTRTTIGIVSVTSDSIILFPQKKRDYPSRSYIPSVESRRWMDDSDKEWTPDSSDEPQRFSIKEFHDTYKKY